MSYFIIEETLGYKIGLADDNNPAPKGVKSFDTEEEVLSVIQDIENQISIDLETFADPFKDVKDKLNKLNVQALREILDKAKIDYKGLNKAALIDLIIENNLI